MSLGAGYSLDASAHSGIGTGGAQEAGVSQTSAIGSGAGTRGPSFLFASSGSKIDAPSTNRQDGVTAVPNDPLGVAGNFNSVIIYAILAVGGIAAIVMMLPKRK